jgi:hypothetical protein
VKKNFKQRLNITPLFFWLLFAFAILLNGCADTYYGDVNRTPEARYNTYYAPHYYPYYPWYSYYGGAYYYRE